MKNAGFALPTHRSLKKQFKRFVFDRYFRWEVDALLAPAPFWNKAHIVNHLAAARGYRRYLEICTAMTGYRFAEVDRSRFDVCHRLMYRCPADFSDSMPIDFRSTDLDLRECVNQIKARGLRYDVILVDPWHEYETSHRSLTVALDLLDDLGTIVVHDCLPPTERCASPKYVSGDWSGVTYKAYLDVVLARSDLVYFTVDTDYGCGVIRKADDSISRLSNSILSSQTTPHSVVRHLAQMVRPRRDDRDLKLKRAALARDWFKLGDDFPSAFRFLREHKVPLLNLVSVQDFLREGK